MSRIDRYILTAFAFPFFVIGVFTAFGFFVVVGSLWDGQHGPEGFDFQLFGIGLLALSSCLIPGRLAWRVPRWLTSDDASEGFWRLLIVSSFALGFVGTIWIYLLDH